MGEVGMAVQKSIQTRVVGLGIIRYSSVAISHYVAFWPILWESTCVKPSKLGIHNIIHFKKITLKLS